MDTSLPVESGEDRLVNLIVDKERAATLKELSMHLPSITLTDHQLCDIELLATGALSPLTGFMARSDYESVLDRMQLQDGTCWPVPICLGISQKQGERLESGQSLAIRDPEGFLLAVMHLESIWAIDKEKEATLVFGTQDRQHPGVHDLFAAGNHYYIGGRLEVLSLPLHFDFKALRQSPG